MRILHITSHLGGGLGTVIMDWVKKENARSPEKHEIMCLDYANEKAQKWANGNDIALGWNKIQPPTHWLLYDSIQHADIVVLHFYDHPMIYELLSSSLPPSRMVFWCHKNFVVPEKYLAYPDLFLDTSPIQGHGRHIWSCGDMSRFLALEKKAHEGFNIGTVASPKLHPAFRDICKGIKEAVPSARFTILGPHNSECSYPEYFNFVGKVDDVAPYLAEMDCFLYPLRKDHWGTAEQAIGEAMSAGLVPVVMYNNAENKIVEYGKNGLSCKDEKECVAETSFLYENSKHRKRMAVGAKQTSRFLYDHDKMIRQWNEVFAGMMKSRKTLKEPVAL